ncbi:MAG: CoA transferase, partial [Deltaproteobacteria bacterium]|nr:CoA transferase [Deltaproteobacteria bacterium]
MLPESLRHRRPLEGVRVLDLTRLLPGPFASLVLADLGAAVDKLEDPFPGDYLRQMPPSVDGQGSAWQALNRDKRSLVIDLKSPEGVETLRRIVPRY